MTSRDFCFWLQGYFEIGGVTHDTLSEEQVSCIQKHLALVFVHEIDPSMGGPEHQAKLNETHAPPLTLDDVKAALDEHKKTTPHSSGSHGPLVMRC